MNAKQDTKTIQVRKNTAPSRKLNGKTKKEKYSLCRENSKPLPLCPTPPSSDAPPPPPELSSPLQLFAALSSNDERGKERCQRREEREARSEERGEKIDEKRDKKHVSGTIDISCTWRRAQWFRISSPFFMISSFSAIFFAIKLCSNSFALSSAYNVVQEQRGEKGSIVYGDERKVGE